jgi:beta-glucanase (GH16 family)
VKPQVRRPTFVASPVSNRPSPNVTIDLARFEDNDDDFGDYDHDTGDHDYLGEHDDYLGDSGFLDDHDYTDDHAPETGLSALNGQTGYDKQIARDRLLKRQKRRYGLRCLIAGLLTGSLASSLVLLPFVGNDAGPPSPRRPTALTVDAPGERVLTSMTFETGVDNWKAWWSQGKVSAINGMLSVFGAPSATASVQIDTVAPGNRHGLELTMPRSASLTIDILQFNSAWESLRTISLSPLAEDSSATDATAATDDTDRDDIVSSDDGLIVTRRFFVLDKKARHITVGLASNQPFDLSEVRLIDRGPADVPGAPATADPRTPDSGWKLVWGDEFEQPGLDRAKWVPVNGMIDTNDELQCYADAPETVAVSNGHLQLSALRAPAMCSSSGTPQGSAPAVEREFRSAMVRTKGRFSTRGGKIVVRARFDNGSGIWPSIWMLPEQDGLTNSLGNAPDPAGADAAGQNAAGTAEIAIAEIDKLGQRTFGSLHFDASAASDGRGSRTGSAEIPRGSDEFHEYGLEWTENTLRWTLDGKTFYETGSGSDPWFPPTGQSWPAPMDQPFYLIVNVAVGGAWAGTPDAKTVFPAVTEIDWIRVFKPTGSAS